MAKRERTYDLGERTARFGEETIQLLKSVRQTTITRPLVSQLVRSATSVGANYCEAHDSFSRDDFKYRLSICRKESKETAYWLRMMSEADPEMKEQCCRLADEAIQLNRIFSASLKTMTSDK